MLWLCCALLLRAEAAETIAAPTSTADQALLVAETVQALQKQAPAMHDAFVRWLERSGKAGSVKRLEFSLKLQPEQAPVWQAEVADERFRQDISALVPPVSVPINAPLVFEMAESLSAPIPASVPITIPTPVVLPANQPLVAEKRCLDQPVRTVLVDEASIAAELADWQLDIPELQRSPDPDEALESWQGFLQQHWRALAAEKCWSGRLTVLVLRGASGDVLRVKVWLAGVEAPESWRLALSRFWRQRPASPPRNQPEWFRIDATLAQATTEVAP
jgi:hypothetical protein